MQLLSSSVLEIVSIKDNLDQWTVKGNHLASVKHFVSNDMSTFACFVVDRNIFMESIVVDASWKCDQFFQILGAKGQRLSPKFKKKVRVKFK